MPQITKKTVAGVDAGTVDLDDALFATQPNVPVMHQVVTAQLAARRSGTQSTKTRSEVRGGGAKPYRQKGTGNARQGSIRSPQFVGGGVALGPKPRSYAQKTPKKMIALALRSALSDRAAADKIVVVDEWGWEQPSTKQAKAALAKLGVDGKALVVLGRDDVTAALSFRNLPEVQLIAPAELNAYDVLSNEWIIFTESVLPESKPDTKSAKREPGRVGQVAETVVDAATTVADKVTGAATSVVDTVTDAITPDDDADEDQPDASADDIATGDASATDDAAAAEGSAADDEPAIERGTK